MDQLGLRVSPLDCGMSWLVFKYKTACLYFKSKSADIRSLIAVYIANKRRVKAQKLLHRAPLM